MSYHVFFAFSSGLRKPLKAPKGTHAAILKHVQEVEATLNLKTTQYKDNPKHWDSVKLAWQDIDDDVLCKTVESHNDFVRRLYHDMAKWSESPVNGGEKITPAMAAEWWHGLEILSVPTSRWTRDYYRARMECLYEVMRGRETDGITWDSKVPLSPDQAANVIGLFAEFLDDHDLRLDVPRGHDYLASSYDGGYEWCEKCGAVCYDDAIDCKRRGCPLRKELRDEE